MGWKEQMSIPSGVWAAYASRANQVLNDTIVRAGIAAMMPHMEHQQRRSLLYSLQGGPKVVHPTSAAETASAAAVYGIEYEDARVLN